MNSPWTISSRSPRRGNGITFPSGRSGWTGSSRDSWSRFHGTLVDTSGVHMKAKNFFFVGILLFAFGLTRAALGETRQLAWSAVTTYTDGSPIEAGPTESYKAYWSPDPSLYPT